MSTYTQQQIQVIRRCQRSVQFFISQFCRCKHPKLGVIPFQLFDYQQDALLRFLKERFLIFRKTRQCGISTVVGAYALWYAMFGASKTVLIVSKRDDDAKEFLDKNVKFVHDRLPDWMRALWPRIIDNEHKVGFPNGSRITSLSSSKDTLRSNSASLVILDETAHMTHMDDMWSAGAPTLQHAGQCLAIGTPNGVGNWYWQTVTDAKEKLNYFGLIEIDWWDMRWRLEHVNPVTGEKTVIAPTDGIRRTETPDEKRRYGEWWSPWLEEQYRQLTQRGDDKKFQQEVLARFLGSGNTVLAQESIENIQQQHVSEHIEVSNVEYVNPVTEERAVLEFDKKFWIWNKPIKGDPQILPSAIRAGLKGPQKPRKEAHFYAAGVDTPEGDGSDFAAIEVFDILEREQVAELKIKVPPKILARMADYIGRYYNNALLVVESTGIGRATVLELEDLGYPNLWRQKKPTHTHSKKLSPPGYRMNPSTKPLMNKALLDNAGTEDGYAIKSFRLYKELCIYVHLSGGKTGNEPGKGNNDDLVVAAGLAFVGCNDFIRFSGALAPYTQPVQDPRGEIAQTPQDVAEAQQKISELAAKGGPRSLAPLMPMMDSIMPSAENDVMSFARSMGGIPHGQHPVARRKHILQPVVRPRPTPPPPR